MIVKDIIDKILATNMVKIIKIKNSDAEHCDSRKAVEVAITALLELGEKIMKNKPIDLNNHLFEQLERLNDETLTKDELDIEVERSKAMANVASMIIDNTKVQLSGLKLQCEYGLQDKGIKGFLSLED